MKFDTSSTHQEEQSFRNAKLQQPMIGLRQPPQTQSKAMDQLLNNFLDNRQQLAQKEQNSHQQINNNPIISLVQVQNQELQRKNKDQIDSQYSEVQQNDVENGLGKKKGRTDQTTSSFLRGISSPNHNLDQTINKLYAQALKVQKRSEKDFSSNIQTNQSSNLQTKQSRQFDYDMKLSKISDAPKDSIHCEKNDQGLDIKPKQSIKDKVNLISKEVGKFKKVVTQIQFSNKQGKSIEKLSQNGNNLLLNVLDVTLKQNPTLQTASNLRENKDLFLIAVPINKPQESHRTYKNIKSAREADSFPIMGISSYLFGHDLLLGYHKINELRLIQEEEIMKHSKIFQNTQNIPQIQELLSSYKYDDYSSFLMKTNPQFFTLCQENYNLFLLGSILGKNKTKWDGQYMPKENHIPYLRSLGFLIDQKASEQIGKLIQSYYLTTQDEAHLNLDKKYKYKYTFDGVLLSILACQCLNPNPQSLKESLFFFDEKQTGILEKAQTKDILCSVGEGVTIEEIGVFYDEFQDWKLYENQHRQVNEKTQKVSKQLKYKPSPNVISLQLEFMISDAYKILTLLPY